MPLHLDGPQVPLPSGVVLPPDLAEVLTGSSDADLTGLAARIEAARRSGWRTS